MMPTPPPADVPGEPSTKKLLREIDAQADATIQAGEELQRRLTRSGKLKVKKPEREGPCSSA